MKTYCKHDLLHEPGFCFTHVLKSFRKKWKRRSYQKAIAHYCKIPASEVRQKVLDGRKEDLYYGLMRIAEEFISELGNRRFLLKPIFYRIKIDGLSGKTRNIGIESVKQQCFEHIIVGAMQELWDAKITSHQYASVEDRGQVAGMKKIRKWIRSDIRSARCAKKFGRPHARKCSKFVKLDIAKCFPSITRAVVMRFLYRDIGKNKDLLWCVDELLKTHEVGGNGLVIGSLLSQFLCNYLLSYAYREVMSYTKERRGKRVRLIHHALFFMDDLLLIGSDRRDVKSAVNRLARYMKTEIGLTVKDNWHIKDLDKEPIDMMGYVVHGDGHVTIRARVFLRARRTFLRAERSALTAKRARRIMAYNGYFDHTNSRKVCENLRVSKVKRRARRAIRTHDRKERNLCLKEFSTAESSSKSKSVAAPSKGLPTSGFAATNKPKPTAPEI